MKDNQTIVVGLHFGHDAGVAVLINGIPKCNLIRERHNRCKHSFGINVSHIEEALFDANLKVEDIDMVAITSTQCYELVVVDKTDELILEYGQDPNRKFGSVLYDKYFTEEDSRFQNFLVGENVINRVYSNNENSKYQTNLFPEYKYIKKEDLGITKSLRDFPGLNSWHKELKLNDISRLNLENFVNKKDEIQDLFHEISLVLLFSIIWRMPHLLFITVKLINL